MSQRFRRRGREVEGTPLLREHAVKNCIKGSNPFVSATASTIPAVPIRNVRSAAGMDAVSASMQKIIQGADPAVELAEARRLMGTQ